MLRLVAANEPPNQTCLIPQVVENMRRGMSPPEAAKHAVRRIAQKFPEYIGAVVAVDKSGQHAGACHGWSFTYAVRTADILAVQLFNVESEQMRSAGRTVVA